MGQLSMASGGGAAVEEGSYDLFDPAGPPTLQCSYTSARGKCSKMFAAVRGKTFCDQHTCGKGGCVGQKATQAQFCAVHGGGGGGGGGGGVAAAAAAKRAANELVPGQTYTKLWDAAYDGEDAKVQALLAAGAEPDTAKATNGATPVFVAAQKGQLTCLQALLAAGAKPETARKDEGSTPIYMAAKGGHLTCLQALLSAGASPATPLHAHMTAYPLTPVKVAKKNGHTECVALLQRYL
jgi:hypothetical protein